MSLFFVDSGCDLGFDTIKKLGIESINLPYSINDKQLEYSQDFEADKFYSKFKKGVCVNFLPLTEQNYIDIFDPCLSQGDDIIYVHSSSKIIDYQTLYSAREKLLQSYPDRKFELVDTANVSIGQGLIAYECALLYRKGYSVSEIYEQSFEIKNNYAMYFSCDSLEQMCNNNIIDSNLVSGTALNIKPILAVNFDGEIEIIDKVSGKKKVISRLVELCRQTGQNVADYMIGIVYSSDQKSAEELKCKLNEVFGDEITVIMERVSPSNAALLGNSVLGISFRVHKKKL